jgi:Ni,Fe-hydrogenase maturation factor
MKRRTLLIAVGNPLRGDDGVAERVLALIPERNDVARKAVLASRPSWPKSSPATPGCAFSTQRCKPNNPPSKPSTSTAASLTAHRSPHALSPEGLVALARELYGFAGSVSLCTLPARDFDAPFRLSEDAATGAEKAAQLLDNLLAREDGGTRA